MKTLMIILAVLLFINLLPIGGHVIYNESGLKLKLVFGLIEIKLLPKKVKKKLKAPKNPGGDEPSPKPVETAEQKQKKTEKKEKSQIKKLRKKIKPKEPVPLGETIDKFLPFVRMAMNAIADLRWLPTIRHLKLRIAYGGGDAGTIAQNYGKVWAIAGAGMAILTRNLKIRHYDILPELDYEAAAMRISADACITLTLGGLLGYLLHYGFKALTLFIQMKNKEKAVKKNDESSTT